MTRTFKAKVMLGHKNTYANTYAIVVPFDPTDEWPAIAPGTMTLQDDPRGGRGWPVAGSVDDGDEVDVTVSPRLP
jgi:hypothetical protein